MLAACLTVPVTPVPLRLAGVELARFGALLARFGALRARPFDALLVERLELLRFAVAARLVLARFAVPPDRFAALVF